VVRPDSPPQSWKLRLSNPEIDKYSYRFVHHLRNGQTVTTGTKESKATALPVDDPFPNALDLQLVPLWDDTVRQVFVDVSYDGRTQHFAFEGADRQWRKAHFAGGDANLDEFTQWRWTTERDNTLVQRAPVTTVDTLIGLAP